MEEQYFSEFWDSQEGAKNRAEELGDGWTATNIGGVWLVSKVTN